MAAILDEMRRLEAARVSGAMSDIEFDSARAALLAQVDDVELQTPEACKPSRPTPPVARDPGNGDVFNIAVLFITGAGALTALAAWVIGDLTLALTLSATVLAAIAVRAMQKLDE